MYKLFPKTLNFWSIQFCLGTHTKAHIVAQNVGGGCCF